MGREVETGVVAWAGSMRHEWCGGDVRRYQEDLRVRRQEHGAILTLMLEIVGIEHA